MPLAVAPPVSGIERSVSVPEPPAPAPAPAGSTVVRIELDLGPGLPDERVRRLLWTLEELAQAARGVRIAPTAATRVPAAITTASVVVDPRSRTVRRRGKLVGLTRREFDLLLFLARHPRQVFTRQQLLWQVWEAGEGGTRTVDVHIHRLRAKLGSPGRPLIATVRGVGYRLAEHADLAIVPGEFVPAERP
ncbi:MAG TPA: winged helix-turn-helix domain-containing protein [Natronosporangium sp.]